jgi:hypothetical protein
VNRSGCGVNPSAVRGEPVGSHIGCKRTAEGPVPSRRDRP